MFNATAIIRLFVKAAFHYYSKLQTWLQTSFSAKSGQQISTSLQQKCPEFLNAAKYCRVAPFSERERDLL